MKHRPSESDEPQLFSKLVKAAGKVIGVGLLLGSIWAGYAHFVLGYVWLPYTGFKDKTIWDLLELIIVPAALAFGALWLNHNERKNEREIAAQQRRQDLVIARERRYDTTLELYFDRMTALMLEESLGESTPYDSVRNIARIRTLAVLRRLDGDHKAEVLQFLCESGLISRDPIVDLTGANLKEADLRGATLNEVDLSGVNAVEVKLNKARLRKANLRGIVMSDSDLSEADLTGADLELARLERVKLRKTTLTDANLYGTNLSRAVYSEEEIKKAKSLKYAVMADGRKQKE
jgi:hypothetical protein